MDETTHNPGKFVVAVVEDEALIRFAACQTLSDAGFEVIELEHIDTALAVLQERSDRIHAIFTDVHVPGAMDGLGLAQHSRQNWPWIVVLITSGRARPGPVDLPSGHRFLPKPYDPDHAVGHLREMLGVD